MSIPAQEAEAGFGDSPHRFPVYRDEAEIIENLFGNDILNAPLQLNANAGFLPGCITQMLK